MLRRSRRSALFGRRSGSCRLWLPRVVTVIDWSESSLPPTVTGTVVTVGTFDGVHLGHVECIRRLVDRAREVGAPSLLLSFDPHPLEVVNPSAAPLLLTTTEEKLEVIAETGVDYFAIMPFTHELAGY